MVSMELNFLPVLIPLLCLLLGRSYASLPAEIYWRSKLPNTPIPPKLQKLLQRDMGEKFSFWDMGFQSSPSFKSTEGYVYSQPSELPDQNGYVYSQASKLSENGYVYSQPSKLPKNGYVYSQPSKLSENGYVYSQPSTLPENGYVYSQLSKLSKPFKVPKNGYVYSQSSKLPRNGYVYSQPSKLLKPSKLPENGYVYSQPSKLSENGYVYSQPSKLSGNGYVYSQPSKLLKPSKLPENGYVYSQPSKLPKNGYVYSQLSKLSENGYVYSQPSKLFKNGYVYSRSSKLSETGYVYSQPFKPSSNGKASIKGVHDGRNKPKKHLTNSPFLYNDLHEGKKMRLHITKSTNKARILPHQVAESIPVSSDKLPKFLKHFSIKPESTESKIIKKTLTDCESPGVKGENKTCVTSLESLIDFTIAHIGNNVEVHYNEIEKPTIEQEYTILEVKMMGKNPVICHKQKYPYAVYYCHYIKATKVYMASLMGEDGTKSKATVVCHSDTSSFNPKNMFLALLNIKPGEGTVCHIINSDTIIWLST